MDIAYNKTDGVVLPITNTRISASEYNQIAGSCMEIINASGLTPDAGDNEQLLNALKTILGPYIVSTYHNNSDWYRIWSDGWCEQGGANNSGNISGWQTVYFAKPYSNTNYYISVVEVNSTQRNFNIDGTNSSYFRYEAINVVGNKVRWYACGYIN